MTDERRQACARFVSDLRRVFGPRLRACAAYGPAIEDTATPGEAISTLVLVDLMTADDLTACGGSTRHWHRAGLATPLVLTLDEFRRSLDAFPLEYAAIAASHVVLAGDPPFAGLTIDPADIRRALEVQVKSHLIHLREGYMEAAGDMGALSRLVVASAAPLLALLQNLARLEGVRADTPAAVARAAAERFGVSGGVVADVLGLAQQGPGATADPARLFLAYLSMMEALAAGIDAWHA